MSFFVAAQVTFSKKLHKNVPHKDKDKFNLHAASLMTVSPLSHVLYSLHEG